MPQLKESDFEYTSLKVLPVPSTITPDRPSGIPEHVRGILAELNNAKLTRLPEGFATNMCVDCDLVTDPETGLDVRSCSECYCFICSSLKCPANTLSASKAIFDAEELDISHDLFGSMLGCLGCAIAGVLAVAPPSTKIEFDDFIPTLVSSTARSRLHLGCAVLKCSKGQRLDGELRCPVCKSIVFPPRIDEPDTLVMPELMSVPETAPPANTRLTTIDLFSAIMSIDPRVASFNDIHDGVRGWANGSPPSEVGVDLRRRARTLEWYLKIEQPQPLPPSRSSHLQYAEKKGLSLLAKTQRYSTSRRKARTVEATAEGTLIHQRYGVPCDDAEDYAAILGPSITECLVSPAELRDIQGANSKPKRKVAPNGAANRLSTGVLGESAFVMARSQRLLTMQSKWDQINVGDVDTSV